MEISSLLSREDILAYLLPLLDGLTEYREEEIRMAASRLLASLARCLEVSDAEEELLPRLLSAVQDGSYNGRKVRQNPI